MATLIDSPEFTANEIYEIQATDAVEGAATGASFNGIGLSNQPHQQLANRTAFIKQRQDTNIANIGSLQSFTALFKGLMGASGYLEIPYLDVNRGLTVAIAQWGVVTGITSGNDLDYTVTWPTAFPNACVWALTSLQNSADNADCGRSVMETVSFNATTGKFKVDNIGGSSQSQAQNSGFYWIAIGF